MPEPPPEPPYDRALALAAEVRTMRHHFLEVSCGCGERRVIALERMAADRRFATATLAHVALKLACLGCATGPDAIHLCATVHGRHPPQNGGGTTWTLPLVTRADQPSYQRQPR